MNVETSCALYARFLRGLAASPGGAAFRVGADTATYAEVHRTALLWAGALLRRTPVPLGAVGVLAAKGATAYTGLLAGLYAGVTVVPLQPDFPAARTRQMIEAAGVSALVVDERGRARADELRAVGLDVAILDPAASPPDPALALAHPRPVEAADIAYVLFTSGSTGRPKGVPITHGNTAHYFAFLDRRYDFTADDVFSQTFDLTFDCAMFDLFCAWGAGATAVAVPPHAYRDLPAFLREQEVTVWFSTPSAIAMVRRRGGLEPGSMPGLRWSMFAGEALKCADATDWQRAADASTLENLYGPTELTITIAGHRWNQETSPGLGVNGLSPIGAVNDGHDHVLLDEAGQPSDTEGELWIAGPQTTPGYLDPADDAGRFAERDGRLWYNTGDRIRRAANGELVYLGRADAQVQVQGWRVELAEIDHAVCGCTGVTDAVTVSSTINGVTELVVFYTGTPTRPADLAAELRRVLPPGIIPRHYRHMDELPLNPNRKVDRAGLRDRAVDVLSGAGKGA
ncbi:amino acid adenylation domain-containing protein [Streptosporangium becharense]|uniref:Amino acid adenylation domain-containing protein n=1 Tax=Streptosporangium becharense TaxID=1816182 RepID=A0A7W9MF81_9ACTN|nr:AMP-binding protein [Streptosporangium becharense]MBB2913061.1 amino acid adenylation domain-containing protein [Streptosporangium becharense]MBB5818114.1 amino acid adenylation domain-containing protein [Streptosporangium becharense]